MLNNLRNRALAHDLGGAVNRLVLTNDRAELDDLSIEQIRLLAAQRIVPIDSYLWFYVEQRLAAGK